MCDKVGFRWESSMGSHRVGHDWRDLAAAAAAAVSVPAMFLWISHSFFLPTYINFVLGLTFLQMTIWLPAVTSAPCCPVHKHGETASKSLCNTIKWSYWGSWALLHFTTYYVAKEKPWVIYKPELPEPVPIAKIYTWDLGWNQFYQSDSASSQRRRAGMNDGLCHFHTVEEGPESFCQHSHVLEYALPSYTHESSLCAKYLSEKDIQYNKWLAPEIS